MNDYVNKLCVISWERHRGPGQLAKSLEKGLPLVGVDVVPFDDTDNVACLGWDEQRLSIRQLKNKKVLLGPNLWRSPKERLEVLKQFNHYVVPSYHVKKKHEAQLPPGIAGKYIHTWSGGIDTDMWYPLEGVNPTVDCLIYFKNRSIEELKTCIKLVQDMGLSWVGLQYGRYDEPHLEYACQISRFAIFLNNTESQGYAYMQALSTNTPCLIFNTDKLYHEGEEFDATSAPYFDDRCGIISNDIGDAPIIEMLDRISQFNPREYICENHTLEIAARNYVELFTSCHY